MVHATAALALALTAAPCAAQFIQGELASPMTTALRGNNVNNARVARNADIPVYNFKQFQRALEEAQEEKVPVTIVISEPIEYTENLEELGAGTDVVIRAPAGHDGYMLLDANGAGDEYEEVRRHLLINNGRVTAYGIEFANGFRTGPQVPTHTGGSVSVNGEAGSFTAIKCKFRANHVHKELQNGEYTGGGGGALYAIEGAILLDQVVFVENESFSQNGGQSNPNRIGGGQDLFANDGSKIVVRNVEVLGGGGGKSDYQSMAWVQESAPMDCLYTIGGSKAACYGANSHCVDEQQYNAGWGVKCECDKGYMLDDLAQTCMKK